MSGIFDRLTRGLLGRNAPDSTGAAPGTGSKVEAGVGGGPHDPSPVPGLDGRVPTAAEVASPSGPPQPTDLGDSERPSDEYSPERDAREDSPGFGDGSPGSDISEYRRGDESGSPERDISEYRDGNALPPRQEGGLAYRSEDVVTPEPPESGPIQASMTPTVAGSESDAGTAIDDAGESLADAGRVDSPLGTADMVGAPTESASAGGIPTEGESLNFGEIEYEYEPGPEGKTMGSGPMAYDVEEQGEGSRDVDEPDEGAPAEAVETGGPAYRSDDVVADSAESRPLQARMGDTVAEDEDTKESTDDADSSDKGSGEPPAVAGPTGPLNASDASSLDGGGAVEDEEAPLTLMDFKVTEDELPAVIEDTGADLGTEALPDLAELGVDEDDAPPVE